MAEVAKGRPSWERGRLARVRENKAEGAGEGGTAWVDASAPPPCAYAPCYASPLRPFRRSSMKAVSVRQLESNPSAALRDAREQPVMVLNHHQPEALLIHLRDDSLLAERGVRLALATALYKDESLSLGRPPSSPASGWSTSSNTSPNWAYRWRGEPTRYARTWRRWMSGSEDDALRPDAPIAAVRSSRRPRTRSAPSPPCPAPSERNRGSPAPAHRGRVRLDPR